MNWIDINVNDLSAETIDGKPIPFDVSQEHDDCGDERYSILYPETKLYYDINSVDFVEFRDDVVYEAMYHDYEPMYNTIYPIPNVDADHLLKNHGTQLVGIDVAGDTYLALTGCGMDFSWEICEAYIICGYLPPLHFVHLPQMADKKLDARTRKIVEACNRSCAITKLRADNALNHLHNIFINLEK